MRGFKSLFLRQRKTLPDEMSAESFFVAFACLRRCPQCGKESRKVTRTITTFERTADLQNCNNAKKHRANALCFFYCPTQNRKIRTFHFTMDRSDFVLFCQVNCAGVDGTKEGVRHMSHLLLSFHEFFSDSCFSFWLRCFFHSSKSLRPSSVAR